VADDHDLDPERILAGLKEFQRRTVEHAFRRMYLDHLPATRFLVADEVGLGKTLVARGIIAKAVHLLAHRTAVDRIDIVYICSNAAIARQNINRLRIFRDTDLALATRLTLLPIQMGELRRKPRGRKKINLVSFTPGTTFDLKSRGGRRDERLVLYFMLKGELGLSPKGLRRILRGTVTPRNWLRHIRGWDEEIDAELRHNFLVALRRDHELLVRLRDACEQHQWRGPVPRKVSQLRLEVTGKLRELLARVCADALEPDLIILDEFQRFRELLEVEEPSEAAELAQTLMNYRDRATNRSARILLLSATPYRMLTLHHEEDDDHYADFVRTLRFLFEGSGVGVEEIEQDLQRLRRGLFGVGLSLEAAAAIRRRIEDRLRLVMSRTERVGATLARDAMLHECLVESPVPPGDLRAAAATGRVAEALGAGDTVEYWKSAPYLLGLMRDYELKRKLVERARKPVDGLDAAMRAAAAHGLRQDAVQAYAHIDPGNARLRTLFRETLDAGQWRWLWMPPSLPYWSPGSAYATAGATTKTLVFSSWNVVPDAIAALASYEAERLTLNQDGKPPEYAHLSEKRSALLQFKLDEAGRPGGMTTLALFYPSVTLARAVDPLAIALDHGAGSALAIESARARARDALRPRVEALHSGSGDGRADPSWYWVALARLDAEHAPEAIDWCASRDGWRTVGQEEQGDRGERFPEHVYRFVDAAPADGHLGRHPDDLLDALADLALAGPGPCALRALGRVFPDRRLDDPVLLGGAALVAEGMRSLFNQPGAAALIRRGRHTTPPYWRLVLEHNLEGNLQAVLDEYFHVLRDSLGLVGHEQEDDAIVQLSRTAFEALSLRTSRVKVDEFSVRGTHIDTQSFNLRTHFALRFGDMKDESGATVVRAGAVREAFNSPFRPFVLASTSIGQEGLDFHSYCHVLYHWNLPSNPVDLEQREGRIHRYKGHAVRKNVAAELGLRALAEGWDRRSDPWDHLFACASAGASDRAGDLIPFWIYERPNGACIERRVPLLPLSRERGQLTRLKRALAVYRLVFGQPRQQDLLEHLADSETSDRLDALRISLAPPDDGTSRVPS
jgi:hypothetical protein